LFYVVDYKEIKNMNKNVEEIKNILDRLYEKYLESNSIYEINISAIKKSEFHNFYKNYQIYNFDDLITLLDSIFEGVLTNIMDTYSRFSYSKDYIKVLKCFSNYITNIYIVQ
jgi:hypothetical protein